jgi:DNA replication protein DnaC
MSLLNKDLESTIGGHLHQRSWPISKPQHCSSCGASHEGLFGVCDTCMDSRIAKVEEERKEERQARLMLEWKRISPLLYRDTDWDSPGLSDACRHIARKWPVTRVGPGLLLYGSTGKGKTRAMWEVLKRHHFAGIRVCAASALDIQEAVVDKNSTDQLERQNARKLLQAAKDAGILLIDDIGKERTSQAVAAVLHKIVELRSHFRKPILWTTELGSDALAQRLGEEYANGLVRRIVEFSEIVEA